MLKRNYVAIGVNMVTQMFQMSRGGGMLLDNFYNNYLIALPSNNHPFNPPQLAINYLIGMDYQVLLKVGVFKK